MKTNIWILYGKKNFDFTIIKITYILVLIILILYNQTFGVNCVRLTIFICLFKSRFDIVSDIQICHFYCYLPISLVIK